MKIKKCPICKTSGFEVTRYKQEGGFCVLCDIWVVPQSSRKGIQQVRGLDANLHIQFHKNGVPTQTWKEYQNEQREKIENDNKIIKGITQTRTASSKIRHVLFKKANYRCEECGATNKETRLEIDHVVPWVKGGQTIIENLQVLCITCNRVKHTDTWRAGE